MLQLGKLTTGVILAACVAIGATLPAPAMAQDKITIATGSTSLLFGPVYVAAELGFFENEGLDVEVIDMKGGPKDIAAVAGGSAQICACATTSALGADSKGVDLKLFATVLNQYDQNLVVQGDIASKAGVSIESPFKDKANLLKGLTIGVTNPGSGTDQMLRYVVKQAGLDPDRDITITYLGSPSAAVAAFQRKRIDGFLMSSPSAQAAEVLSDGLIIFQPARGEIDALKDLAYVTLGAQEQWLKENPEIVAKFMTGYQNALDAIHKDPKTAGEAVFNAHFKQTDRAVFDKAWTDALRSYAIDAKIQLSGGQKLVDFYNEAAGASLRFDESVTFNTETGGKSQ